MQNKSAVDIVFLCNNGVIYITEISLESQDIEEQRLEAEVLYNIYPAEIHRKLKSR